MAHLLQKRIRLLLVDDHEVVRLGLRTLFRRTGNIEVIGEAHTVADAITKATLLMPDVVLLDLRLPDGSGVEACREIRATCPNTHVLFLTSYGDNEAVMAAICGGAKGYLLKEIGNEALITAIATVAAGHPVLSPAATQPVIAKLKALAEHEPDSKTSILSFQEQRVLALVAQGKTNKEIAIELTLSEKTVKNYLSNIFQKLQITRRSQAAAFFVKQSSQMP